MILSISILFACDESSQQPDLQRASKTFLYFDSSVSVSIFVPEETSEEKIENVFNNVDDILKKVHRLATRHESFKGVVNVHTINENPGKIHRVDPLLYELLEMAVEYHELTDGYFDITLGPVLDTWDDIESCVSEMGCYLPGDEDLEASSRKTGIDKLIMGSHDNVVLYEEDMVLDLGGIAKGFAADKVTEYLKSDSVIDSFLVNAGTSNIEVHGSHPTRESGKWNIALTDPENPNDKDGLGAVQVDSDMSVVTSGDYVRYFSINDERYHHLINPKTLYPSTHYRSVTLIIENGAIGDILSTAAFLMPREESEDFISSLDDVEALWVYPDGSREMSEGFEDYVLEWRD